jgi:NAD(P)-dependent dehydrogenase (short-subunit alcohol dehydrogenase family)
MGDAMGRAVTKWTEDRVPELAGTTALVTGANSGLGFETARVLAARGAHVLLGCRNKDKADDAMAAIREHSPEASLELVQMDLSSLSSVQQAAERVRAQHEHLDLLINNAGVMWLPPLRTEDGFEMHFGTNHLGHFALTGHLLPLLRDRVGARIVTLSSIGHRIGRIHFDDLDLEHGYGKQKAYSQSKLANLMFAQELQRRLQAANAQAISVAAHPGIAGTNLATPALEKTGPQWLARLTARLAPVLARPPVQGALPSLYAATAADVNGGDYIGPDGLYEITGYPAKGRVSPRALDQDQGRRLWSVSEELTGVRPDLPSTA